MCYSKHASASGASNSGTPPRTGNGKRGRDEFHEAGRFLGKEDFEVTREGFTLRIRGHARADAQSLVAGLDEAIALPADADWARISAEYKSCALSIFVGRSAELREWLA